MIINIDTVTNQILIILLLSTIIIGRIMTISMSKIKNNTANRKNWIENGVRDLLLGSNPHSNGDIFSRSRIDFFEITVHTIINPIEIMVVIHTDIKIVIIILFNYLSLLIGS